MRVLGLLYVVLRGSCWANAASHSLKYIYTVVTGDTDSPEFIIMGLVDDEQFVQYDSNIRRMIPQTEWREISVDKQYWDKQTQKALYAHQICKDNIGIAMQHFRSTQGVHILEWIVACRWNDETGETGGIERYGYDGKYFLTDDMKNWHFIPPAQQLFISAVKWNSDELENDKQYQTQICIESLKTYVSYKRTLERTVAPEVSLLQKDSFSPVITCHVTGFYPRDIMVTWQRNGEDLDVDVELGGTVPNEDGTFQARSHLRVKPEDWKSQNYTCTVQHKSLKQDIILPVREENIKRNTDIKTRSFNPDSSSHPMAVIIGCVVGALILILILILALAVIGSVIWKKRSSARSFNPDGSSPPKGVLIGCLVGAFIHILAFTLALISFVIWKEISSAHSFSFDGSSRPMGVIIGCLVGALILILILILAVAVISSVIWKKRRSARSFNPDGCSPPKGVLIGCLVGAFIHILAFTLALISFVIWKEISSAHRFNPDGSSRPMGVIIGCLVGALILILALAVIGSAIWTKRSLDYGTTKTFDNDAGHCTNMQLIHITSDRLAACDTCSMNIIKIRPAATDTDSVNST